MAKSPTIKEPQSQMVETASTPKNHQDDPTTPGLSRVAEKKKKSSSTPPKFNWLNDLE